MTQDSLTLSGRKGLLLSAYDACSHRLWRENLLQMFPGISWTVLTLPPRYFQWRIRGNSLSWAFNHRDSLTDNHDFLLSTSMTDLSALRGFVPALAQLPTAVYFHENQFAYPASTQQFHSVEPGMLNLYTALCADTLLFNSAWNRSSFLAGVDALLRKLPDHVPAGLVEKLSAARVLPVPLAGALFRPNRMAGPAKEPEVLNLVWNHRWEYDKGPSLLLAIVQGLIRTGIRFRLHLLGEQFRQQPPEFAALLSALDTHYSQTGIAPGQTGFLSERTRYLEVLEQSDVVLSTADHDFQGLSILEGIARGCSPLTPDRLSYPEYLPAECRYQDQTDAIARLAAYAAQKRAGIPLPVPDISRFSADSLKPQYAEVLSGLNKDLSGL